MLLVGQGGDGKSTVLGELCRLFSDTFGKCVVVVGTTSRLTFRGHFHFLQPLRGCQPQATRSELSRFAPGPRAKTDEY